MTVDARKERNHYFDLLKYLLFIFVVLIHNPLPENLWGGVNITVRQSRQSGVARFFRNYPF